MDSEYGSDQQSSSDDDLSQAGSVGMEGKPDTGLLNDEEFLWDRKTIQRLWKISTAAHSTTFIKGEDPMKLETIKSAVAGGRPIVLRGHSKPEFSLWHSAAFEVVKTADSGLLIDAKMRGSAYESGNTYNPPTNTLHEAFSKSRSIWALEIPVRDCDPRFSDLQEIWASSCIGQSSVLVTTGQFWTNVCPGIGGTYERPKPFVTASHLLYGTQQVFFADMQCTTRVPFLHVCEKMSNYMYDGIPYWKRLTLFPGDTLICPPSLCIARYSDGSKYGNGLVAVQHSFITPVQLPILELSVELARRISFDPSGVKPVLTNWMMSTAEPAAELSVGAKESLWRLLTLQWIHDQEEDAEQEGVDLDRPRTVVYNKPTTPISSSMRSGEVHYSLDRGLDLEVLKKLMQVVPKSSRKSNFFGWTTPFPWPEVTVESMGH